MESKGIVHRNGFRVIASLAVIFLSALLIHDLKTDSITSESVLWMISVIILPVLIVFSGMTVFIDVIFIYYVGLILFVIYLEDRDFLDDRLLIWNIAYCLACLIPLLFYKKCFYLDFTKVTSKIALALIFVGATFYHQYYYSTLYQHDKEFDNSEEKFSRAVRLTQKAGVSYYNKNRGQGIKNSSIATQTMVSNLCSRLTSNGNCRMFLLKKISYSGNYSYQIPIKVAFLFEQEEFDTLTSEEVEEFENLVVVDRIGYETFLDKIFPILRLTIPEHSLYTLILFSLLIFFSFARNENHGGYSSLLVLTYSIILLFIINHPSYFVVLEESKYHPFSVRKFEYYWTIPFLISLVVLNYTLRTINFSSGKSLNFEAYLLGVKDTKVSLTVPSVTIKAETATVTKVEPTEGASNSSLGIADELKKLSELKEAGILTEEEFEAQKRKLLNKDSMSFS